MSPSHLGGEHPHITHVDRAWNLPCDSFDAVRQPLGCWPGGGCSVLTAGHTSQDPAHPGGSTGNLKRVELRVDVCLGHGGHKPLVPCRFIPSECAHGSRGAQQVLFVPDTPTSVVAALCGGGGGVVGPGDGIAIIQMRREGTAQYLHVTLRTLPFIIP